MKRIDPDDPLFDEVARGTGLSRDQVVAAVKLFHACLRDEVWLQRRVQIPELGTFEIKRAKARRCPAPPGTRNSDPVQIAAADVVKFRASSNWRRR